MSRWFNSSVFAVLGVIVLAMPNLAAADETWDSTFGTLTYLDDDDVLAVLGYPGGEGYSDGHVVLENLAGNTAKRGVSVGMWFAEATIGEAPCGYTVYNPYTGQPTDTWGRVRFEFTAPGWAESDFVGLYGYCGDEPSNEWNGVHN